MVDKRCSLVGETTNLHLYRKIRIDLLKIDLGRWENLEVELEHMRTLPHVSMLSSRCYSKGASSGLGFVSPNIIAQVEVAIEVNILLPKRRSWSWTSPVIVGAAGGPAQFSWRARRTSWMAGGQGASENPD